MINHKNVVKTHTTDPVEFTIRGFYPEVKSWHDETAISPRQFNDDIYQGNWRYSRDNS